jgi:hypothetical protein
MDSEVHKESNCNARMRQGGSLLNLPPHRFQQRLASRMVAFDIDDAVQPDQRQQDRFVSPMEIGGLVSGIVADCRG